MTLRHYYLFVFCEISWNQSGWGTGLLAPPSDILDGAKTGNSSIPFFFSFFLRYCPTVMEDEKKSRLLFYIPSRLSYDKSSIVFHSVVRYIWQSNDVKTPWTPNTFAHAPDQLLDYRRINLCYQNTLYWLVLYGKRIRIGVERTVKQMQDVYRF